MQIGLLVLVGLLVSTLAVGTGVGYTLGTKAMWPVYTIAGVAGLVIACIAAYYFWYKPRQRRSTLAVDERSAASIKARPAEILPLFTMQ